MTGDDVRRQRKHSWSCVPFTERALGERVPVPKRQPSQLLSSTTPPPKAEGPRHLSCKETHGSDQ